MNPFWWALSCPHQQSFLPAKYLKLSDINKYLIALYIFKVFDKFESFSNHNYNTRGKFLLRPKFQRTTVTQQSIVYRGHKIWNSLSDSI